MKEESTKNVYQIYDKIFKKILTLSNRSVIQLINGLFQTEYPLDSSITYHWTEHEDTDLRRTLADTILVINHCHAYHLEAQMYEDGDIVFRMFDYGYGYAEQNRARDEKGMAVLQFPEPQILYLYSEKNVPKEYKLLLKFGKQGEFIYRIPVCNFATISIDEMNEKKMIILIPFQLLKVRRLLEHERSTENLECLKKLIKVDIMDAIEMNYRMGNIVRDDVIKLRNLVMKLYQHLYAHYNEMEVSGMNDEIEDYLILESEIFLKEYYEKVDELEKTIGEKEREIDEKDKEIQNKTKEIEKKENEIESAIITNMLREKMNEELISRVTKLPLEHVYEIKKQMGLQVHEETSYMKE